MNHAALILVLLLGFVLKASTVMGAEEFTEVEGDNVAHYRQQPNNGSAASAAASASASSNGQEWVDSDNNYGNYNEPTQSIQNNNNITVGSPAAATNVNTMGKGYVPNPTVVAGAVAYAGDDVSSVLGVRERYVDRYSRLSLTPMFGGSWYATEWNDHIGNNYTFGLALDVPMNPYVSFEAESGFAKYNISYGYAPGFPPYSHYFNQYLLGGNLKAYLTRTDFRPFVGGGLMGVLYEGMSRGPMMPIAYNQFIGSAQIIAGAEYMASDTIAIGVRGAYLIPVFNRPYTVSNAYTSAPGFEEAAAINTNFYKLMATLRVAL